MRVFALFLIFVFALSSVSALNDVSYLNTRTVVSMPVDVVVDGSPVVDYIRLNYSWIPKDDFRQDVLSLSTEPSAKLFGDSVVFETVDASDFVAKVVLDSRTTNDYFGISEKIDFPIGNLDSSLSSFVRETDLIDITPEIKDIASQLAEGEDDLFVVVFKIADWVNSNIEYDLSTVNSEANLASSVVLDQRSGVCDEMSNLFISMVRSLGIPARSVSGISYTSSELFDEPWGSHAWTEVYFPGHGWVPFDPTYNQLGYVDASHIKLDDGIDSDRFNTQYSWKGRGFDVVVGEQNIDVFIIEEGPKPEGDVSIVLDLFEDDVSFGSYNVVTAKITNLMDYYVSEAVSISRTVDLEQVSEGTREVLLKPGETKDLSFVVRVDPGLKKGFFYDFPVSVYTQTGERANGSFRSSESGSFVSRSVAESVLDVVSLKKERGFISCDAPDAVYVGANFSVVCSVSGFQGGNVRVCLDGVCKNVPSSSFDSFSFDIVLDESGFRTLLIKADTLGYVASDYIKVNVVGDSNLSISGISVPGVVEFDELANLSFIISSDKGFVTAAVDVSLIHDFFSQEWSLNDFSGDQEFVFEFKGSNLKPGINEFVLNVSYFDALGKKYFVSETLKTELVNLSLWERVRTWFNFALGWFD